LEVRVTAIVGAEEFAAARRASGDGAAQGARAAREAAFAALIEARAAFAEQAEQRYVSGARLAARDSDRIEALAARLLDIVDGLEAEVERLDVARDVSIEVGFSGRRFARSRWDRAGLVVAFGEVLQELLDPCAAAVFSAAIRLEACA
jgi:hypothetical protein